IEVRPLGERTDADIARAATDALRWNALVPDDAIKVEVSNGWITLRGEVMYDFERRAAERAVRYLNGVRGVTNLIQIKPRIEPKDVKEQIERRFEREALLDARNISVQVSGSEVILRGSVRSWVEREEAERAAWAVPGITSVKNYITVSAVA
ncbi:MAG: BON domain-containing protein, partial [Actinomycetota bacterium]